MPPSRKPNYAAFPKVHYDGANLLVVAHELENFKRGLIGLPPLPVDPAAPLKFKRLKQAADELGWHPKKIKRIGYQQRADEAKAAAEAKAATAAVVAKRAPAKRRLEPVGGE